MSNHIFIKSVLLLTMSSSAWAFSAASNLSVGDKVEPGQLPSLMGVAPVTFTLGQDANAGSKSSSDYNRLNEQGLKTGVWRDSSQKQGCINEKKWENGIVVESLIWSNKCQTSSRLVVQFDQKGRKTFAYEVVSFDSPTEGKHIKNEALVIANWTDLKEQNDDVLPSGKKDINEVGQKSNAEKAQQQFFSIDLKYDSAKNITLKEIRESNETYWTFPRQQSPEGVMEWRGLTNARTTQDTSYIESTYDIYEQGPMSLKKRLNLVDSNKYLWTTTLKTQNSTELEYTHEETNDYANMGVSSPALILTKELRSVGEQSTPVIRAYFPVGSKFIQVLPSSDCYRVFGMQVDYNSHHYYAMNEFALTDTILGERIEGTTAQANLTQEKYKENPTAYCSWGSR